MTLNSYVLIDYENVQPTELRLPGDEPFRVMLFLGASQTKVSVSLAKAMHALGDLAEYVQLDSNSPNALDFHIAYYIGRISVVDPNAAFHVISNDTGYDPLIRHLKSRGIRIQRSVTFGAPAGVLKNALPKTPGPGIPAAIGSELDEESDDLDRLNFAIDYLTRANGSKPQSKKTLMNSLRRMFQGKLTENQIATLFEQLCVRSIVTVDGTKVRYDLPAEDDDIPF